MKIMEANSILRGDIIYRQEDGERVGTAMQIVDVRLPVRNLVEVSYWKYDTETGKSSGAQRVYQFPFLEKVILFASGFGGAF